MYGRGMKVRSGKSGGRGLRLWRGSKRCRHRVEGRPQGITPEAIGGILSVSVKDRSMKQSAKAQVLRRRSQISTLLNRHRMPIGTVSPSGAHCKVYSSTNHYFFV